MKTASQRFSDAQRAQVTRAVVEAEAKTSAELVPVVATASGRYDRAEDVVGLWLTVITAVVLWIFLPGSNEDAGSWGGFPIVWQVVILIVAMAAAFVLGAVLGSRIGWLRRLFTPRREMRDEVNRRAREVFFDSRVHHTAAGSGLLLYVSLFEHQAAVIADRDVLEKLGQDVLDQLCNELIDLLRTGHPSEALCATLASAAERLAEVLPRQDDDVNELADALVTLD
ncbi:MAG: hypothetical protein RIC55_36930 [Pirellulaceae bacterium]